MAGGQVVLDTLNGTKPGNAMGVNNVYRQGEGNIMHSIHAISLGLCKWFLAMHWLCRRWGGPMKSSRSTLEISPPSLYPRAPLRRYPTPS